MKIIIEFESWAEVEEFRGKSQTAPKEERKKAPKETPRKPEKEPEEDPVEEPEEEPEKDPAPAREGVTMAQARETLMALNKKVGRNVAKSIIKEITGKGMLTDVDEADLAAIVERARKEMEDAG